MAAKDAAEIKKFANKLSFIAKHDLTIQDRALRSEVKGEIQKTIEKLNSISGRVEVKSKSTS